MFKLGQWTKRVVFLGLAASVVLFARGYPGGGEASGLLQTAPSLGTAQSFAVLGGSTVTNTGPTIIIGDLGVSPGSAVTGFPPGIVVGTTHANDAVAVQAQSDLTAAYDNLAGQPCTADLTGQDLGGRTLTPGVYCFSSSAQLTGFLTLNGQGNANAVFIFRTGSTLTTATGSSILLINSAQNCNVFWQVGSSATLGTTTTFVGNILALTSITLMTDARVFGRALARNGAVTMDSNSVSASGCAAPTATPSATVTPTATATATPTPPGATPTPPAATPTPLAATATAVAATATAGAATATAVTAATATAIVAATAVAGTATVAAATAVPAATATLVAAATATSVAATATAVPAATATSVAAATATSVAATATAVPAATATSVAAATATSVAAATATSVAATTAVPAATATSVAAAQGARCIGNIRGSKVDGAGRGLAGWTIRLLRGDEVVRTVVTGSAGNFEFLGLDMGAYGVQEVPQTGWVAQGPTSINATLAACDQNLTGYRFVNVLATEILTPTTTPVAPTTATPVAPTSTPSATPAQSPTARAGLPTRLPSTGDPSGLAVIWIALGSGGAALVGFSVLLRRRR